MPCSPESVPPSSTRGLEDLGRGGAHARHLGAVALVAQDVGVQIAVADVAEDRDLQRVAGGDLAHAGDQSAAIARRGTADVLAQLVGPAPRQRRRDARAGRSTAARTRPRCAPPAPRARRARGPARAICASSSSTTRSSLPSAPKMQDRVGVQRQADRPVLLDAAHGQVVEDLDRGRQDAGRHHRGHGGGRVVDAVEHGQRGARVLGLGQQFERDLGDRAERALRAGEQPAQVVAGDVLDRPAAGADHRAVGQHHLQRQHVVAGHAVLEAARAAGVLGHVAADRALLEAGGIGRVEQPALLDLGLQPGVDHAGLHDRDPVDLVDGQDGVHPRHAQHDAAAQRHRAAGEAAAHRPRGERHAAGAGDAVHGRHLGGRGGQHHQRRGVLVERAVEAVGDQVARVGQHPARNRGAQRVDQVRRRIDHPRTLRRGAREVLARAGGLLGPRTVPGPGGRPRDRADLRPGCYGRGPRRGTLPAWPTSSRPSTGFPPSLGSSASFPPSSRRSGSRPSDAAIVADVLVAADLRGIESHGVARLESYYVSRIRAGQLVARPEVDDGARDRDLAGGRRRQRPGPPHRQAHHGAHPGQGRGRAARRSARCATPTTTASPATTR